MFNEKTQQWAEEVFNKIDHKLTTKTGPKQIRSGGVMVFGLA